MTKVLNKSNYVIIKRLFASAVLSMFIVEFTNSITSVIDGIVTGQFLGSLSLAASGLGSPYFSITCLISLMLMVGCTLRCTNAIGKGNTQDVIRAFSLTMSIALFLGLVLAILGYSFSDVFVNMFGGGNASPELKQLTSSYLKGVFIGAPSFIILVILNPLVQLDGNQHLTKFSSIAIIFVDIVGDLLNALVFKGGMFGMGLSTSLAHIVGASILLTHFFRKDRMLKYSFKLIKFKDIPGLMWDGLPMVSSMIGRALLPIILNNLIIYYVGDFGTTAYSALISATFVISALGWGIGGAVMMIGGMMYSEQDIHGLKITIIQGLKFILIGVVSIGIAVFLLSPLLARVFIPDEGTAYNYLVEAFKIYSIALPFIAFNVLIANYSQATNKKIEANIINFCIEVLFTAISAVILINIFGMKGVWLAFLVGNATLSLILALRYLIFRDKSKKGFYSLMGLKKDFGINEEDTIECSLQTMDDVIGLSNSIHEFCEKHNFTKKETYRLALCIEEMAGNVIEHGFNDGKEHHLDLRIIYKDDLIVLRMRDDCRKFDFSEQAKKWAFDKNHPESNIGIRLVLGSAQKIDYTNAMNKNNLIVTIKRG